MLLAVRSEARRGVYRDGARREPFDDRESSAQIKACVCARAARPASRCGLDEKRVLRSSIRGKRCLLASAGRGKPESCFG